MTTKRQRTESSPLLVKPYVADSLATVTPAIQQQLAALSTQLSAQLSQQTAAICAQIAQGHDRLFQYTQSNGQRVEAKLTGLITCLSGCLSDLANRLTILNREQNESASTIVAGAASHVATSTVFAGLQQSHAVHDVQRARGSSPHSPLGAPQTSIIHDGSSTTAMSNVKMHAVARAIADDRRAKGETDRRMMPSVMPPCNLVPRPNTLRGIWEEWFYGVDGAPSIMKMDAWYGTAWRSDKRAADAGEKQDFAGLYLFKKTIVLSVLCFIRDGVPVDMAMVDKALADFGSMLHEEYNSCSLAAYYKLLPKGKSRRYGDREDKMRGKGKGRKE